MTASFTVYFTEPSQYNADLTGELFSLLASIRRRRFPLASQPPGFPAFLDFKHYSFQASQPFDLCPFSFSLLPPTSNEVILNPPQALPFPIRLFPPSAFPLPHSKASIRRRHFPFSFQPWAISFDSPCSLRYALCFNFPHSEIRIPLPPGLPPSHLLFFFIPNSAFPLPHSKASIRRRRFPFTFNLSPQTSNLRPNAFLSSNEVLLKPNAFKPLSSNLNPPQALAFSLQAL